MMVRVRKSPEMYAFQSRVDELAIRRLVWVLAEGSESVGVNEAFQLVQERYWPVVGWAMGGVGDG